MEYIRSSFLNGITALDMKLFVVLSVIACSYAAKLDRTYLPPASASSAGGSPGALNTPFGSTNQAGQSSKPSDFGQPSDGSGFGQSVGPAFGKASGPLNFGQEEASVTGQQFGSAGLGQSSGVPKYGQNSGSPTYSARPNAYSQSGSGFGQSPSFSYTPSAFEQGNQRVQGPNAYSVQGYQPERPRASLDRNSDILRYDNQNDGDTFAYSFETSNGITAGESGVATNGVQAQGGYSYTADDGQVITVAYTADENGYQPRGDHLPTPPPIPDEILKSIEDNAKAAAAGTQEGSYRPEEDNSGYAPQKYSNGPATSYDQGQGYSGQTGASTYNRPQGKGQVSQQYGVPNAGAALSAGRPLTGLQGYNQAQKEYETQAQNQGPSQQYGAPTTDAVYSAGKPSSGPKGYNQQQNQYQPQGPAQQYSSSNLGAVPSANKPSTGPQGLNKPENQYQSNTQGFAVPYGSQTGSAPKDSATAGSQGFNQIKPSQSQPRPSQPSSFIPANQGVARQNGFQGFARPQNQDDSGYQYRRPEGSSQVGGESAQRRPSPALGQSRLEIRPSQQSGQFSSGTPAQESFVRPSGISGQGFGPASGLSVQGSFGRTEPGVQGPRQYQLSQPTGPKSPMPGDSGYNYNRPESQSPAGSRPQQPSYQQNGYKPNTFNQGGSSQAFEGPRQAPSFSPEEGYKY